VLFYTSLSPNMVAMHVFEQINKQKSTSKKETMTCNIHIAHYTHNHLGLCHKHFAIASKVTISNQSWFCGFVFICSLGNLKLKKNRATVIYNVFIVCFYRRHKDCGRKCPDGHYISDTCGSDVIWLQG